MGASSSLPRPKAYSKVVADSAAPDKGLGPVHRNPAFPGELHATHYPDAKTLYDVFQRGVRLSKRHRCMGYRVRDADGNAGAFSWLTYGEVADMRDNLGSGMIHLNLNPVNGDGGLRLVGLFAKNRYEWVVTEQACNAFGSVLVPMYDTLGPDAVSYVINQCELTTVFVGQEQAAEVLRVKRRQPDATATLRNVVQFEDVSSAERKAAAEVGVTLRSLGDVMAAGKENPQEHVAPSADDVATFCYTSGTTGDPKGAMLSHGNIVADCSAAMKAGVVLERADTHLSYLPLAHMFERVVQCVVWMSGAHVGFCQGDPLRLMDDLQELQPSLFPSVPRLFNKIHDKVMAGVKSKGGFAATLFEKGYEAKQYWLRRGYLEYPFWDALVFDKIRLRLGLARCRLMLTGSAPIAPHVVEFLRVVFSCPVMEGYGQTECTAAATLTHLKDQSVSGHVGMPLACNEICLADVPEMGYLSTDTTHGEGDAAVRCHGRGEVCYRGPNVFRGYYRMPEKTREALHPDGWLHSGDIGLWTEHQALKIIDRKKNIFKLAQGEYVAAERIENVYCGSLVVQQCFVYGDSLQAALVAIVVPEPTQLAAMAKAAGIAGTTAELCGHADVKKLVHAEMARVGKAGHLRGFEHAREVHLTPDVWTQGDLLTPTFKLKRNVARERFREAIDDMYARYVVAGKKGLRADGAAMPAS